MFAGELFRTTAIGHVALGSALLRGRSCPREQARALWSGELGDQLKGGATVETVAGDAALSALAVASRNSDLAAAEVCEWGSYMGEFLTLFYDTLNDHGMAWRDCF